MLLSLRRMIIGDEGIAGVFLSFFRLTLYVTIPRLMNIVLIGYRGSGKTTIGRKLAEQLWKDFIDTDDQALRRLGRRTIAEVWDQLGETAWRDAEADAAADLLERDELVIALGGGTLTHPRAREAVGAAAHATRIYLQCEPEQLLNRIRADHATDAARPNLTSLGGGIEEVKRVLAEREPTYLDLADHVFDVTHVDPDDAVRYLIARCL